ncbi:MAG: carboxypeptidase-like regulatory domain-containing protein, partial [Spirosomataceae bacterium]
MNNLSATDNELLIYSIYLQTNVTHAFMKWTLFSILLLAINTSVSAAAYKGTVKNQDGEILPYASIFVKNTNLGTNSNANGEFSISLEPGTYEIIFRYLGYETISKSITIG